MVMSFDPNIEGWFSEDDATLYRDLAIRACGLGGPIIEVGTWLGKSLMAVSDLGRIVCVDTWNGSHEHQNTGHNLECLYERFIAALAARDLLGKVTPIRMESVTAAALMASAGVKASLVFIDANHEYKAVEEDIKAWKQIVLPGGIMAGHDYNPGWPGVIEAVDAMFPNAIKAPAGGSSIWYVTL